MPFDFGTESVAVAGAAEARLFGPHRHGARGQVL
jgi:hypothetical protein